MTLLGQFDLHGRSKRVSIPARVTYLRESEKTRSKMPGDLIGIRANFTVALADYGITGPAGMDLVGSKVGESVDLEVSVFASNERPSAGNPCNPCGGKVTKASNPCNPCGGKGTKNPCNPCGGKYSKGG